MTIYIKCLENCLARTVFAAIIRRQGGKMSWQGTHHEKCSAVKISQICVALLFLTASYASKTCALVSPSAE